MTQVRNGLLAAAVLLLAPHLLPVGSSASAADRYYICETVEDGDSLVWGIEFSGDSGEILDAPVQFTEVTEEQLEAKGLLTAEQQQAQTDADDTEYGPDPDHLKKVGHSWIYFTWNGSRIYTYLGSETRRLSTLAPGYIWVHGDRTNETKGLTQSATAVDTHGSRIAVWWRNTHIPGTLYYWSQLGYHKWQNVQDPEASTDCDATEH